MEKDKEEIMERISNIAEREGIRPSDVFFYLSPKISDLDFGTVTVDLVKDDICDHVWRQEYSEIDGVSSFDGFLCEKCHSFLDIDSVEDILNATARNVIGPTLKGYYTDE